MNDTSKQTLLSALRHLLTALGSAAVAHGWVTQSQVVEAVGALVTLVGFIWGPLDEYLAAKRIQDDARIAAAIKTAVDAALAGRAPTQPAPNL